MQNKDSDMLQYEIMKYKLANDALNVALWDMNVVEGDPINPDNEFTWSNEIRQMLGYDNEVDFPNIMRSWSDRLHPDDRERTLNQFRAHIEDKSGKTPYDIEYRLMTKEGEFRHFHALGTTLRDDEQNPLRVAGALMDITEKKQIAESLQQALHESQMTQEKLKQRESLLQAVNRAADVLLTSEDNADFDDAVVLGMEIIGQAMEIDSVEVWQNEMAKGELYAILKHHWYSAAGKNARAETFLVEFPYSISPQWDERLALGEVITGAITELSPEDREFLEPFNLKSVLTIPLFHKNELWGICCIDDCHRERSFTAEEIDILKSGALMLSNAVIRNYQAAEIREADERALLMLNSTPLCCQLWDQNYNIIDCNEAALKLYGFSSKQEYIERFFELFPPLQPDGQNSREKSRQFMQKAFAEGHAKIDWENRMPATGEPIPMEITLARVRYKGEYALAVYTRDLREHNKMIADIRDTSMRLEAALEEATISSKAKGDFLSSMSHEMRTPLNAVIGMTAIGKKAKDMEQKNSALQRIDEASSHLLAVINDILDMAKIEANRLELSPIEFNVERMLKGVASITSYSMREKRQIFNSYIDHKVPQFIICDDQRLSQVITNLLSNASKFTEEGGNINLNVSLESEDKESYTLLFEVNDNGIGISPEQQDKLFQVFTQAESGISRKFGGTGLGLALCKRVIELMGGNIWVESEVGKGSTFKFTIRVERSEQQMELPLSPLAQQQNLKILVVDDDRFMRRHLEIVFMDVGLSCQTASGGKEALEKIETEGDFDLYIVDWRMPGMDGIELTQRIKKKSEAYIVLISSDWSLVESEARQAGVDRFMSKPIFSTDIIECINDYLHVESESQAESPMDAAQGKFSGKRLLLAEDIELNREIVMSLLEGTGLAIDIAVNGQVAFDMVSAQPERYDLVFMDVHMPEMDGLSATRLIRKLKSNAAKTIPIIALTANVFREDVEECLAAGMNDHLGKPLDVNQIYEKLFTYLT